MPGCTVETKMRKIRDAASIGEVSQVQEEFGFAVINAGKEVKHPFPNSILTGFLYVHIAILPLTCAWTAAIRAS